MSKKRLYYSIIIICISIFLLKFITYAGTSTLKKENKKILNVKYFDVLKAKIGSGSDKIGVTTPSEANSEGPMSFTLGKDGKIYILDQINYRIQIFKEGKWIKSIPIPKNNLLDFKDIEITPENKIVLLSQLYKEGKVTLMNIYIIDLDGKIINSIKTNPCTPEINIVKEGNLAGIWVCFQRVAFLDGKKTEEIFIPQESYLGEKSILRAEILGDITAIIYKGKQDKISQMQEATIYFDMPIVHILGTWEDKEGKIYFGAFLSERNEKGKYKYANEFVVLSPELSELGRFRIHVQKEPHEIWRSIRVTPEGHIYQMFIDGKSILVRKYEIR
ncbi:hypothetical protein THER_0078 [Thermodesulfovibrio sp. N1]|uniref:hypothetical protein n=1 Tax=unclassified Thermodesulfovibrio TaxID=2645936 RepID=UPI00083B81A6|nr:MULTISPECIES: hypothetical protein [unclassified Thermodesulfovibrio]MDI1472039.1 hypothetical protein [Thermodesulfovibrio sp. 1176]ODA45203.1 hypothetical protein THER_0078 [Thermodesulfovibrio sp. N1]